MMILGPFWAISGASGLGLCGSARQGYQACEASRAQTRPSAQRGARRKVAFRRQLRRWLGKPADSRGEILGDRSQASSVAFCYLHFRSARGEFSTNRLMSRPILLDYPGKRQMFRGNISLSNVPGIRLRPYRPTAYACLTAVLAGAVAVSQIVSPV